MSTLPALLVSVEGSALAAALRDSVWAYPLINAGHILGVSLLIGAIIPLDLRLLGAWPSLPLNPLWRVLTRTAATGLALAVVCGALLFAARATAYIDSPLFMSKMAVVALGALNALLAHVGAIDLQRSSGVERYQPTRRLRVAAIVSIVAWLTSLLLGRLVGYF